MLAIHSETSRAYCLVVMLLPEPAGEHKFTGLFGGRSHVIVHSLAGLFRQLEPYGLPRLSLSNRGAIDCISTRSDILNLEGDDIATAQLTIDSQIEHCQITHPVLYLQLGPD